MSKINALIGPLIGSLLGPFILLILAGLITVTISYVTIFWLFDKSEPDDDVPVASDAAEREMRRGSARRGPRSPRR